MIKVGKTFGNKALGQEDIIDVYECEICGWRYKENQKDWKCCNPDCSKGKLSK